MLEVTTNHINSRAPGKVHHRFVDVFLWQLFSDGRQGDFQLISRLRLECMVLLQYDVTVANSTVPYMTYNVIGGTLNFTQPNPTKRLASSNLESLVVIHSGQSVCSWF